MHKEATTSVVYIVCNNWTVLPMPAEVIATVHQLAKACKKYKGIIFMDKHGNIIHDTLMLDGNKDADDITGVMRIHCKIQH